MPDNEPKLILPGMPEWMNHYEVKGHSIAEFHAKMLESIQDPSPRMSSYDGCEGPDFEISCHEIDGPMSKNNQILEEYKRWLGDITDHDDPGDNNGFNLLHEVWTPKWKWFRPPMWKIFRWAYKFKRTLYTNCYPVSMSTNYDSDGGDDSSRESFIEFTGTSYRNKHIDEIVDKLKRGR